MQVHDADEDFILFILHCNPVSDRTQIVSYVELTGGLDARKYSRHGLKLGTGRRGCKVQKYTELTNSALEAARIAARYLRTSEPPPDTRWDTKTASSDFVTAIDRTAEQLIADHLNSAFPDSSIMGEELSPDAETGGLVWVVDPLDGTTNYLHGYPAYSVSIAAMIDRDLVSGVVLDVSRSMEYVATKGAGATCNGGPTSVSSRESHRNSLIGTGFPFKALDLLDDYLLQFRSVLTNTSGIRRGGSAAIDLATVASGGMDGFWELHLAPWDVAAGTLIIREAGGLVTNLAGSNSVVTHGPIVAGNPTIHSWLLDLLNA